MADYLVVSSTSNTITVINQPKTLVIGDSAMRGPVGPAPNFSVGNVTTGNASSNATVTNIGNSTNIILDFTIPRGQTGATGQGIVGAMFFYLFDANTSSNASPNTSYFHCDSPNDQANITKLWFNNRDVANANVGNAITSYFNSDSTPKGYISARGFEPGLERLQAAVNSVTLRSGYFELDVTVLANSPDSIDNNDLTGFNFAKTGNTGISYPDAYNQANAAYGQANAAYGQANTGYGQANAAYGQANAAYDAANAATAATVDITDTNGLTTVYYPTFVENRANGQIVRADVDLSYRTDDNKLTVGNISTGTITVKKVFETTNSLANVTGTVTHNCALGHIFVHATPSANFTANFTDVEIPSNNATAFTLVLNQGGTAYVPTAVQVNSQAQTVSWQGGTQPGGNANKKDVVSFSVVNNNGTWITLGQLTTFG